MIGYSAVPLYKKLGLKENSRIIFINEPDNFLSKLGIKIKTEQKLTGQFDYVHFFTKSKAELEKFFPQIRDHLNEGGMFWVSWPKGSFGVTTDINENIIRESGLSNGLVDVKVAAIDEIWSGLKFVYRLKDRFPSRNQESHKI